MKRKWFTAVSLLLAAALAGCGKKVPDSVTIGNGALLLLPGEQVELAVSTEGGGDNAELTGTSGNEGIVRIDGLILTAVGEGSTVVTVAATEDSSVADNCDVLVLDYTGTYSAEKYIDAMGCNIRVQIEFHDDGSFAYVRDPMVVNLDGGGEMPGLEDTGTYEVYEGTFVMRADMLGEYKLAFMLREDNTVELSGQIPTGGAPTQMTLTKETG